MRQKLFTKEIDNMLFKQYAMGADLSKQKVVAKIFNPYGRGCWYIINSDPNDPDYLWAIVDLFEIEAGSVSREDLQTIKVPPFGLNLERDLYFQPINAQELYDRLRQGERFEHGGSVDVIQNDKDESYLTSVNAKPTDAAIKLAGGGMLSSEEKNRLEELQRKEDNDSLNNVENEEYENLVAKYRKTKDYKHYADGGEIAKSWTVMYFKEGKNRFGEKIESAFNNTRVQGTLKEAIENVKEELVGNISYATIKDRSIGDVLVAKVKQDGTINIYREGYGIDKMAKGGTTKNYIYVPKSDIKRILVEDENHNERTINAKDILDGAYVKKSVPKVDKVKLSKRAQSILDSSLESFENKSASSRLSVIKMVEDNLAANKKGIDNIGMGLDEDMVASGKEFLKIVKSKKYEDKPEIELGTFKEARYAKGKMLYIPPTREKGAWKGRQERLAEAKGISGKYTHREKGYIMSKSQAEKLKKYILEGYDAGSMTGELVKHENLYAKGGVTFKDKVKSISNSLKGKKVPSKLKKDYGTTYDKKESVLAATRIAGAMKAKMESKKKR